MAASGSGYWGVASWLCSNNTLRLVYHNKISKWVRKWAETSPARCLDFGPDIFLGCKWHHFLRSVSVMGDVQVALVWSRNLLVEESCGGGSQDECQAQPCSACPKQPVHEPEPSAVYFTYILTWCSASSLLFHPWNETNPPIHTWATKALGLACGTAWLLLWFSLRKQRTALPWNVFHSNIFYHKPSYMLRPLLTVMTRLASPLFLSVFE